MDTHALNVIRGRQLPGLPIPTDLPIPLPIPLPTKRPDATSSSASLSSVTSSSSASLSSTSTSSSSSTSTSLSSSSSSSAAATSFTPSSSFASVLSTSTHTVTALPDLPSSTASPTANPAATSFLRNKVLSGVVFTIVGVIGLTILVMIATLALRRRRNKRLIEEAVSFDPVNLDVNYHDSLENGQITKSKSRTSTSTGLGSNWSHGPEVRNAPVFDSALSLPSYDAANLSLHSQGQQGYHSSFQHQAPSSFYWTAPVQQNNSFRLSPVEEVERSRRSRSTSSTEIKFAPSAVAHNQLGY